VYIAINHKHLFEHHARKKTSELYLKYQSKTLLELKAQQLRNLNEKTRPVKIKSFKYNLRPYEAALCNGT